MRPGPKTRSCLRHRNNKALLGLRFQAVDTRRHAVLEEARKNRVPLVRWAKTITETKSVTFAPAHANHRLNYSLTTYPPTTFLQKAVLLKMCTFISTVLGRGSISLREGEGEREEIFNLLSTPFSSLVAEPGQEWMLIREWWNYPYRVWLL